MPGHAPQPHPDAERADNIIKKQTNNTRSWTPCARMFTCYDLQDDPRDQAQDSEAPASRTNHEFFASEQRQHATSTTQTLQKVTPHLMNSPIFTHLDMHFDTDSKGSTFVASSSRIYRAETTRTKRSQSDAASSPFKWRVTLWSTSTVSFTWSHHSYAKVSE